MDVAGHRPPVREPTQQRPHRELLGPVAVPDQHHRGDRGRVGVVVLAGVLEHLLHGAGRPGQEHDAGVADLQQHRLAHRVADVLGDGGREDVGWLVPVVPGRDAEGLGGTGHVREGVEPDASPGPDPAAVAGHPFDGRDHGPDLVVGPGRQPGTEVGRLHRAGAPGRHRLGVAEQPPEPYGVGVAGAPALDAVAAHDADDGAARHPRRERLVDGVVVQRGREQPVAVEPGLRPGVAAGVEAAAVVGVAVELGGGVEGATVGVERDVGERREDHRPAPLDLGLVTLGEPAAEEHRARDAARPQRAPVLAQVQRAAPPTAEVVRSRGEAAVEVVEVVDLDDPATAVSHGVDPTQRRERGVPQSSATRR